MPAAAVAKRIALLPTHEFSAWVEQCLFTIGSAMTAYERHPERTELVEEALVAADTAKELLLEYRRRVSG